SAGSPSTVVAGTADNLTITAYDQFGNVATGYGGSHGLTFSGANSIGSFNPTVTTSAGVPTAFASLTAINFVNGVSTVSAGANGVLKLYRAESANVSVSDSANSISSSALAIGAIADAPNSIAINAGNNQSATVDTNVATAPSALATDQFGNPVSGVLVTFAVASGGGSLTGGSQTTNASGVATVGSWK